MKKYREEYDSMGKVLVPEEAYYGAQTQRALENFSISGLRFPRPFIRALGLIKKHGAAVNRDLGLLKGGIAEAILNPPPLSPALEQAIARHRSIVKASR